MRIGDYCIGVTKADTLSSYRLWLTWGVIVIPVIAIVRVTVRVTAIVIVIRTVGLMGIVIGIARVIVGQVQLGALGLFRSNFVMARHSVGCGTVRGPTRRNNQIIPI